ncbi:MAG: GspH/FimT family pseudopilin [Sulfuricaulis sp.]|uniref:pilus assembly FimT family protein n=1 Tax=Sulfuricaulis sp. TaxID=2003553 RepID=UPI003C6050F7
MMHIGSSKGFTLVELVATIVIIALIAAVSGPLFFDVDVFRQRGFFEETLSTLRYAQKYAVATGCPVRVQTTATGFTLYRPANAAACAAGPYNTPIADPSGNAATFTRTAPPGVTLSVHNFTFAADGSASANQSINVGGTTFQVVAATGFVSR